MATTAVEQPGLELLAGADDRFGGLTQVVDVVEWIVEAEDVDPALGGARHEPPGEVTADGTRADEEPPAQSQRQWRRRSCFQCADALPRALDASPDRVVEDAAARDLEVREPRPVEDRRQAQDLGGRHPTGERFLAEDADGRVDEARHEVGHYPVPSRASLAAVAPQARRQPGR